MKRILLFSNILEINTRKFNDYHIEIADLYNKKIPNGLIRILNKSFIAENNFLYGSWKESADTYDKIVVFESDVPPEVLIYFYKAGLADKVILYYLNKIANREKRLYLTANKVGITQATYNMHDAKSYKIHYISQFWNQDMALCGTQMPVKWDIVFCGATKDRYDEIAAVLKLANSNSLRTNFWIVSDKGEPGTHKKRISYQSYLQNVKCSNAVLDIVGNDNWGLTWRPLEALFLKKKLITNYTNITDYDFYNDYKENIFIISDDNIDGIVPFLKKKYVFCSLELYHYDIAGWLDNVLSL